ncbi:MAG: CoB--CoM heterodisulfide reductase iron-sulfur subunit B family protein [bacterium]|nr:CoB--CoM heterodisulfide reductase iron-sulfur subunit B family protein [bacterium]
MKLLYYPGCTLKTTAKNFEDSAIKSLQVLGIELVELNRWNCCGTVYSLASDDLIHQLAPIRNLIRVKEQGDRVSGNGDREVRPQVVTLCAMCYNTLKRAELLVTQDDEKRSKINDFMDREKIKYDGGVKILHLLEVLKEFGFDKIRKYVKRNMADLKVVSYYGCMLLRPKEVAIDDTENPTILQEFIKSIGAEPIGFPYLNECCGSYQTVGQVDFVVDRAYKILSLANELGADLIVTSCPLCEFNLDTRQREVQAKYSGFKTIPVLYFTQLLAVAMGMDKEKCRFDLNYIDPTKTLNQFGH